MNAGRQDREHRGVPPVRGCRDGRRGRWYATWRSTMRIESRYNGPTGSGNGGWSAGVFAAEAGGTGPVEVTLRRPPPLETELRLVDGEVRDPAGELVAEVRPVSAVDA